MKYKYLILISAFAMASSIRAAEVSTLTSEFQASGGVVVAPNGDVIVANYGITTLNPNGTTIYRVNANGAISTLASGFIGPTGNVIGPDDELYQSSYVDGKVMKVNEDGSLEVYAEGPEVVGPVGIEFNSQGDLFIANCNNNTLARKSQGTLEIYSNSSLLSCPAGLAIDSEDNLYVTNYGNGHILKYNPTGEMSILATAPGGPTKPGGSNAHITFGNDQLYFVSSATHQVFSLSLTGELEVIAGSGSPGRADGTDREAEFNLPNGIDISADGTTLYVNDSITLGDDTQVAPNVIRKITLNDNTEFQINAGLSGAWYEPATDGSGLFFDVIESNQQLVAGWYTWAEEANPAINSSVGASQQRWVTAVGNYSMGQADLVIHKSSGGVFDQSTPVTTEAAGNMQVKFNDCVTATVDFSFDDGPSGSLEIERISPDQLCDSLAD